MKALREKFILLLTDQILPYMLKLDTVDYLPYYL